MNERSKTTLFLMEQIVVITVFAICAVACVKIFVVSFLITVDSVDIRNALHAAESVAETYKATAGDTGRAVRILSDEFGYYNNNSISIYYDYRWQPSGSNEASFVLHLIKHDSEAPVVLSDVTVSRKEPGGELTELVSLPVAVRRSE